MAAATTAAEQQGVSLMDRRRRLMMGGYPPPLAPSSLSAVAASSSQIDLSWTDNASTETGFSIERSPDGFSNTYVEIGTNAANDTTYSDTGLAAETVYFYRVRAYNAYGYSAYSNAANAETAAENIADTFTGTNGTDPHSRALSSGGTSWNALRGDWDIQGNAGRCHTLDTLLVGNVIVTPCGFADGTIEADILFGAGDGLGGTLGYAGLYVRSNPADGSGIECYLDGQTQNVRVLSNDGAAGRTAIANAAFTPVQDVTYAFRVVLLGTSIKVYVDDVLIVDTTSSTYQAQTAHGLWTWETATVEGISDGDDAHRWDNFAATP